MTNESELLKNKSELEKRCAFYAEYAKRSFKLENSLGLPIGLDKKITENEFLLNSANKKDSK